MPNAIAKIIERWCRWARSAYPAAFAAALLCCGGGDDDAPGVDEEGLAMCCELGATCHPDQTDPLGGQKQACHATGHENEPAKCRAQYDVCMELCAGDTMEEPHACL